MKNRRQLNESNPNTPRYILIECDVVMYKTRLKIWNGVDLMQRRYLHFISFMSSASKIVGVDGISIGQEFPQKRLNRSLEVGSASHTATTTQITLNSKPFDETLHIRYCIIELLTPANDHVRVKPQILSSKRHNDQHVQIQTWQIKYIYI